MTDPVAEDPFEPPPPDPVPEPILDVPEDPPAVGSGDEADGNDLEPA